MKDSSSPIVQAWIDKAEDDLAFAHAGMRDGFYNQVCILCQQVVEKYLKAYLVKAKGGLLKEERIHDLPKLAKLCRAHGLDMSKHYVALRTLSEFYIPARYPDAMLDSFTEKDAADSLEMVEKIIAAIQKKLM